MRYLLVIWFIFMATGCCTKVGCDAPTYPARFSTAQFGDSTLFRTHIKFLEASSGGVYRTLDTGQITGISKDSAGRYTVSFKRVFINGSYSPGPYKPDAMRFTLADTATYFVEKFYYKKLGCNSCFPYRPQSDYYEEMRGYRLKGEDKEGLEVKLD